MDSDSDCIYTYYYSDTNSVTYRVKKHGVIIEKVSLASKPDHATSRVCVIPEKLGGFPVVGMSVDSLDELRMNNIKNVIVPKSMREIGDKKRDLYENFDNKKNPGRTRLKIWFSTKSYNQLEIPVDISNGMFAVLGKENSLLTAADYIPLSKCQMKNGYWAYPGDGKWIVDDENILLRYTGNQLKVKIETTGVAPFAFSQVDVEEIIFSDTTTSFSNHMINRCEKLERIGFEAEGFCEFEQESINGCSELTELDMPSNFTCEGYVVKDCEKLTEVKKEGELIRYLSMEKVIVVGQDISSIANGAFAECKDAEVVYLPDTVKYISKNAFIGTGIHSIIIAGTASWDIALELSREIYLYSIKDSPVFDSALDAYFNTRRHVYGAYTFGNIKVFQKNIDSLREAIEPNIDKDKILRLCVDNMDGENDTDVARLPYRWTGFEP